MEKDEVAIKAWMIMRIDIIVCIMMIVFVLELRRGLVNRFALDFGRGDGEGSVSVFSVFCQSPSPAKSITFSIYFRRQID